LRPPVFYVPSQQDEPPEHAWLGLGTLLVPMRTIGCRNGRIDGDLSPLMRTGRDHSLPCQRLLYPGEKVLRVDLLPVKLPSLRSRASGCPSGTGAVKYGRGRVVPFNDDALSKSPHSPLLAPPANICGELRGRQSREILVIRKCSDSGRTPYTCSLWYKRYCVTGCCLLVRSS
jgi:hypothetical protein